MSLDFISVDVWSYVEPVKLTKGSQVVNMYCVNLEYRITKSLESKKRDHITGSVRKKMGHILSQTFALKSGRAGLRPVGPKS